MQVEVSKGAGQGTDSVKAHVITEGEVLTLRGGVRVRVPGGQVAKCKQTGTDCEPCLLVEWKNALRYLCYAVEFHGPTWLIQSVEEPCLDSGAIIWLETDGPVTLYGKDAEDGLVA